MNTHEEIMDLIPFYLAGNLDADQMAMVRAHLKTCETCREELAFWRSISGVIHEEQAEVEKPADLADAALQTIRTRQSTHWTIIDLLELVRAQIPLIRSEIWTASFLVIMMGVIASMLIDHSAFLYFISPLIAASGLSILFTPQNDPALELIASTPNSKIRILLARVSLVFSYDLVLILFSMVLLSFFMQETITSRLLLEWLAPVTLLSSFALFISLITSSQNAVFISYFLWLLRFFIENKIFYQGFIPPSSLIQTMASASRAFWNNPLIPLCTAGIFFSAAIIYTRFSEFRLRVS